jgi:disulfide bond formation protein DsbB
MNGFLRALEQPEYIHTLLNPLPIYGLALGVVALIIALLMRNRTAQVPALAIISLAAISAWPVAHFGDEAYDRVLSMSDETGGAWLAAHAHRADIFVWCYYALALGALLALVLPRKFPRTRFPLTLLTLALALVSLGAGGYIAYPGGKIRHREFRNEPPPPKPPERG